MGASDARHGGFTREEVIALFGRRDRAMNEHDAARLVADYADDVEIVSPSAGTHRGHEAARKALENVFEGLDIEIQTRQLLVDGDLVAQFAHIQGANLGDLFGLPPTGKLFEVDAAFLFELHDRKIIREHRIYDFTGMLLKIGVLKAKPV